MSTMIPDLVVGEVGFGPNLDPEPSFSRVPWHQYEREIKNLEAEVAELTSQRNRLLEKLAAAALAAGEISETLTAELSSNFPPENA